MNLFSDFASSRQIPTNDRAPLADRMRPTRLEDFVGQQHLVGPGKPVRRLLEKDRISSLILWGPSGHGQDHPGENHCPQHEDGLRSLQCCSFGYQGNPDGDEGS